MEEGSCFVLSFRGLSLDSGFPVVLGAVGIEKIQGEANAFNSTKQRRGRGARNWSTSNDKSARDKRFHPLKASLPSNHAILGKHLLTYGPGLQETGDQSHSKINLSMENCASHRETVHHILMAVGDGWWV